MRKENRVRRFHWILVSYLRGLSARSMYVGSDTALTMIVLLLLLLTVLTV